MAPEQAGVPEGWGRRGQWAGGGRTLAGHRREGGTERGWGGKV